MLLCALLLPVEEIDVETPNVIPVVAVLVSVAPNPPIPVLPIVDAATVALTVW